MPPLGLTPGANCLQFAVHLCAGREHGPELAVVDGHDVDRAILAVRRRQAEELFDENAEVAVRLRIRTAHELAVFDAAEAANMFDLVGGIRKERVGDFVAHELRAAGWVQGVPAIEKMRAHAPEVASAVTGGPAAGRASAGSTMPSPFAPPG